MTTGVYRIRNRVTGDVYIGSAVDIERRVKAHQGLLNIGHHHNKLLQAAWDEHGAPAFAFGIAEETALDYDILGQAESRWLASESRRGRVYNLRLKVRRTRPGTGGRPRYQCPAPTDFLRCFNAVYTAPGDLCEHHARMREIEEQRPKGRKKR